jgi:hypothetical protein
MKREYELEKTIQKAIENTPEGKEIAFHFGSITGVVELVFEFPCGWAVKRNVLPGEAFGLIKGKGDCPEITITINPYDGLNIENK